MKKINIFQLIGFCIFMASLIFGSYMDDGCTYSESWNNSIYVNEDTCPYTQTENVGVFWIPILTLIVGFIMMVAFASNPPPNNSKINTEDGK